MKILGEQTFWVGVMTATSFCFFSLVIALSAGKMYFGQSASSDEGTHVEAQAGGGYPSEPSGYPGEVEVPREIVIEDVTKDDWVRGDRNAKVSIVEFSDIDCPFCSRFHTTMKQVLEQYDGQVNWVYRDFPLDALHPEARDKSIAAECVGKLQGNDAYWTYLDALFASSAADEITVEATKLGINASEFETCRSDQAIADEVAAEVAEAGRAGGTGTPYSVIVAGNEKIPLNGAVPLGQITAQLDGILSN